MSARSCARKRSRPPAPSATKASSTAAQLKEVEDREIEKIVRKQEEVGLKLATDGEYRRSWWHLDFFWGLDGVEKITLPHGIKFHGVETRPEGHKITGKVDFSASHPMLDHFRQLKSVARVMPKMCIPAPPVMHFRLPKDGIPKAIYPDIDNFFADLGQAYAKAVKAFYDAGCRYLQFDDTVWAYLCDASEMQAARQRMPMADNLPQIYQDVINTALQAKPADMTITTHVCRGNFKSTWVSEGGYEPVAERLLGGVNFDGYFLEYDSDRSGGFEPLRFLPKGNKMVVLGLVTSKSGTLEQKDVDQAAHRGSDQIRTARAVLPVAAMRLRLDRGGQHPGRRGAVGEVQADRRTRRRGLGQGLMLLPTSLVGSYPQPDWLIDRASLAKQMPPRVRARSCGASIPRGLAPRRTMPRSSPSATRSAPGSTSSPTASSGARAIPTASPLRSTASTSTTPARRRTAPAASPSCRAWSARSNAAGRSRCAMWNSCAPIPIA